MSTQPERGPAPSPAPPRRLPGAIALALALASAALAACAPEPSTGEPAEARAALLSADSPEPSTGEPAEASPALLPAAACGGGRRWVGVDPAITTACAAPAQCPCPAAPPGWAASRLFTAAAPAPLSSELAPYCQYAWTQAEDPTSQDLAALDNKLQGSIVDLAPDCVVVTALGAGAQAAAAATLREEARAAFLPAARSMGPLPAGVTRTPVEVAILDTSPTAPAGSIPRGPNEHGYTVGWLVRDLGCDPGPPCPVEVGTRLALPHHSDTLTGGSGGGAYGTRSDLARALFAAVEAWRSQAGSRPRLVLPLALGWEGSLSIAAELAHPASSAVRAALRHAACHGAFITAAAGNDTAPGAAGPMYPAALEADPAPGHAVCDALLKEIGQDPSSYPFDPLPDPSAPPAPLVLSAGGLDHADRPIPVTRPASLTALAALALQGVAAAPGDELPPPLTGTSVAAAVAGAAAAAVWTYRPDLHAREVLDLLQATAQPLLAEPPSAHCSGDTGAIRRVSLCGALEAALSVPLACTSSSEPRQNPAFSPALQGVLVNEHAGAWLSAAQVVSTAPPELYPGVAAAPWVHPQPGRPGCDVCVVMPTGDTRILEPTTLYIDIADDYPETLLDITLGLTFVDGTTWTARIAPSMQPGDQRAVGVPYPIHALTGASLSWAVDAGGLRAQREAIPLTP